MAKFDFKLYEGSLFDVATSSSFYKPRCRNRETEGCKGKDVLQRISCFMAIYGRETCFCKKVRSYIARYQVLYTSPAGRPYTSPPGRPYTSPPGRPVHSKSYRPLWEAFSYAALTVRRLSDSKRGIRTAQKRQTCCNAMSQMRITCMEKEYP